MTIQQAIDLINRLLNLLSKPCGEDELFEIEQRLKELKQAVLNKQL